MSEENDKHNRTWKAIAICTLAFMLVCAGLFASRSCQREKPASQPQVNKS